MFRILMLTVFVCLVVADQSRLEFLRDLLKEVRSLGEVKRTFADGEVDKLHQNYNNIRSGTPGSLVWCTAVYDGKLIKAGATGVEYDTLVDQFDAGNRVYAYAVLDCDGVRRYAFITWIGPSVVPLKKARVSTDKAFLKNNDVWPTWRKEFLADEYSELSKNVICNALESAVDSGYNKGTGK